LHDSIVREPPVSRSRVATLASVGRLLLIAFLVAAAAVSSASASAPPVGPLPVGPTKHTFVITLPKSKNSGLVWRIARAYRSSVVRQLDEGETKTTVWLRFRSVAAGKTSLVLALTRGERPHAFAARTFRVTVR
jgi:hypothetical protein